MFVLDSVDLFWWSEPPVVVADKLFNYVGGLEVGIPSDTDVCQNYTVSELLLLECPP